MAGSIRLGESTVAIVFFWDVGTQSASFQNTIWALQGAAKTWIIKKCWGGELTGNSASALRVSNDLKDYVVKSTQYLPAVTNIILGFLMH